MSLPTPTEWGDTGIDWDNPGIYIPFALVELQAAMDERYTAINRTPHRIVTLDLNGVFISSSSSIALLKNVLGEFKKGMLDLTLDGFWHDTTQDKSSPFTSFEDRTYASMLTELSVSDPLPTFAQGYLINYNMLKIWYDMINLLTVSYKPSGVLRDDTKDAEEKTGNGTNYSNASTAYTASSATSVNKRTFSSSLDIATDITLTRVRSKTEYTLIPTDFESILSVFIRPETRFGAGTFDAQGYTGLTEDKWQLQETLSTSASATRVTDFFYDSTLFNSVPVDPGGADNNLNHDLFQHVSTDLFDWSGVNGFEFKV